jgi:tripeptide aminopeptidase
MGLPTPNLFAGEHNFHSCLEWVSAQDMEKAVEVLVNLCCVWEEHAEPGATHLHVNTLRQDG